MEFDAKRMGIMKKVNLTHYAIVICVVLIFLQWFMPYFRYEPQDSKDLKTQTSMWGEILFNYNFMQLEDVMKETLNADGNKNFKFVSLQHLGAPVIMMISGIIILCTMTKKGIAFNVFPLVMAITGIKGWLFGNLIPQFCNVGISKILGLVFIILLLLSTIANIVFCIQEIKSRPADYYLPSLN